MEQVHKGEQELMATKLLDKQPKNKNLRRGRWKPGESGNPLGRPKKIVSLTSAIKEKLGKPCPYAPNQTWLEYIVDRWLTQATLNPTYFKELIERLEGKVVQPIDAEVREIKDVKELTDEQLAIIAAEGFLRDNATKNSNGNFGKKISKE